MIQLSHKTIVYNENKKHIFCIFNVIEINVL